MPKLFRVAVILIALAAAGGGWGAEAEKKLPPARAEIARSVADIAAAIRPALVKVSHLGREGMDGLGSGFVVSADGLIATNRHVIGEARRIQVELSPARQLKHQRQRQRTHCDRPQRQRHGEVLPGGDHQAVINRRARCRCSTHQWPVAEFVNKLPAT